MEYSIAEFFDDMQLNLTAINKICYMRLVEFTATSVYNNRINHISGGYHEHSKR